ncbi:MAG: hypothetical protein ACKPKO_30915, partial [Candidatus Fonsibacter sp.]
EIFFKLMNNSVFGKTMENVKNRIELKLTTDRNLAIRWFSKLHFKDSRECNGFHMIEMYKKEIVYDKPIYVGLSYTISFLYISIIWNPLHSLESLKCNLLNHLIARFLSVVSFNSILFFTFSIVLPNTELFISLKNISRTRSLLASFFQC